MADADGQHPAAYRDQGVEVALGPNPAFPTSRVVAFTRRVPAERGVTGAPSRRGKPRPPREPRPPRVAELLRKAIAWRKQLDSGQVANQAEIARREGVSRARVTQVMGLLQLAAEIQERILALPAARDRATVTEHGLRAIARLGHPAAQLAEFAAIAARTG